MSRLFASQPTGLSNVLATQRNMDLFTSLPPVHYIFAYIFPVFLIGVFFSATTNPQAIAKSLDFKEPQKKEDEPFVYMFAVRELAFGVALLILIACDEWKAVTIVMGCAGIGGMGDFILDVRVGHGWSHVVKTHGLPTLVGYWVVWKLYQNWW